MYNLETLILISRTYIIWNSVRTVCAVIEKSNQSSIEYKAAIIIINLNRTLAVHKTRSATKLWRRYSRYNFYGIQILTKSKIYHSQHQLLYPWSSLSFKHSIYHYHCHHCNHLSSRTPTCHHLFPLVIAHPHMQPLTPSCNHLPPPATTYPHLPPLTNT